MPKLSQMLRDYWHTFRRMSLGLLAGLLLSAILVWQGRHDLHRLPVYLAVAAGIWLLLNLLLMGFILREFRKMLPFSELWAEKGPCEALVQKHCEIYPHPTEGELLKRVDLLLAIEHWGEAEAILNTLRAEAVKPPNILLYYNCLLVLFVETGRASLAYRLFCDNRSMLDAYARTATEHLRGSYYGTVTVLLAMHGDASDSAEYLTRVEQSFPPENFLPQIMRAERLYALGRREEAEALHAQLRADIPASDSLKAEWQKRDLLRMLERAAERGQSDRTEAAE